MLAQRIMTVYRNKMKLALEIFCPSAPMSDPKRFVGREEECLELSRAILAPGRHVVIYGDRGVGKTSAARLVTDSLRKKDKFRIIEYRCGERDNYTSISYKLLNKLGLIHSKKTKSESYEQTLSANVKAFFAKGGAESKRKKEEEFIQLINSELTPDFLVTKFFDKKAIFVIDEFDRIKDENTKLFIADTIKTLSDYKSTAKLIVCGVSNTAEGLFGKHESTIRNICPINIPYMSDSELRELIENGINELDIDFSESLTNMVINLSEGLPYFTHLLCEELTVNAISAKKTKLSISDLYSVMPKSTSRIHDIITTPYIMAINTPKSTGGEFFSPPVSIPRNVRKFVIHGVALSKIPSTENVSGIVTQLIKLSGTWMPDEYKDIDEMDIEVIVDEIIRLSGCLVRDANTIKFKTPFLKAYSMMKAIEEQGQIIINKLEN